MAKQTVNVSDLSGDPIPEGSGAVVRITQNDTGRIYLLDTTTEEADLWATQGREQKKRGRKPKKQQAVPESEPGIANPEPNIYANA